MVNLYVKLITLGRKTIDDVPCALQPKVNEKLEEQLQQNGANN